MQKKVKIIVSDWNNLTVKTDKHEWGKTAEMYKTARIIEINKIFMNLKLYTLYTAFFS